MTQDLRPFVVTVDLWGTGSAVVRGRWRASRLAPPCSDPSDPRFADDGDPGEVEIEEVRLLTGSLIPRGLYRDSDELHELVLEALEKGGAAP